MGLLISVNWTFFARSYTAEALRAIIGSKSAISLQRWAVDPKFQVEWFAPPSIFSWENYAKLSFVWHKNLDWFFFRFVTMHAFVSQRTYRIFSSLDRVCISYSAVIKVTEICFIVERSHICSKTKMKELYKSCRPRCSQLTSQSLGGHATRRCHWLQGFSSWIESNSVWFYSPIRQTQTKIQIYTERYKIKHYHTRSHRKILILKNYE